MEPEDVQAFEARLRAWREELESVREAGEEAARPVELDQTRVGRVSRMDAMQIQAMAKATAGRRQLDLKRIDAALARIAEEDYGYCLRCGEEITRARLEIDPAITLCLDCASRSESR